MAYKRELGIQCDLLERFDALKGGASALLSHVCVGCRTLLFPPALQGQKGSGWEEEVGVREQQAHEDTASLSWQLA